MTMPDTPTVLARGIDRLSRRITALNALSAQFTRWRVGVFFGGLFPIILAFNLGDSWGYAAIALWIGIFGGLVILHQRVKNAIRRFEVWRQFKRESLARVDLDWAHIPPSQFTPDSEHPFSGDLDIVGEYSLHRLLDTTFSQGGGLRLRDWLLQTEPDLQTILTRQTQIQTLRPLTPFREKLRLYARLSSPHGKWDGERLHHWLTHDDTPPMPPRTLLVIAFLAVITVVLAVLHGAGVIPPLWVVSFVAYVVLYLSQWRLLMNLFGRSISLYEALDSLRAVLAFLERYRYPAPIAGLGRPFARAEQRPSAQMRRLQWIVTATSLQNNLILWVMLNIAMPWDAFFAALLHRRKRALAEVVPTWLDAIYEIEALNALAHFAYLNPSYHRPSFTPDARLEVNGLGHPLIPNRVSNDFRLSQGRIVILTGSNMSGKSSFLRTIGVNLSLAYAGSVVCADRLEVGLFRVYTCIKVSDSVVDGISYFYAEVRRLKGLLQALNAAHPLPLLFLIDEIFKGTNNRERLIGSRAYTRALLDGKGCGLISTHDIELATLADTFPQISNAHFREDVRDGRMVFGYQLCDGVSPTTNALRIMALEGLPVESV